MKRTFAVSSLLTSRWFTNIFAPFVCTAHKKEYKAQQEVINKQHTSSERNDIMASSGHKWLEKKKEGFLLDVYGVAYNCGNRTSTITGSREAIDLFVTFIIKIEYNHKLFNIIKYKIINSLFYYYSINFILN